MSGEASNPRTDTQILEHLAPRAAATRLAVEAALHRINMWQLNPARDRAACAEQVLEQVRRILAAVPADAMAAPHRRPVLPAQRKGESR